MSVYKPSKWQIVKIVTEDYVLFKVLASFNRHLDLTWRLNSGITDYYYDPEGTIIFNGSSGSEYYCDRELEGLSRLTTDILTNMQDAAVKSGFFTITPITFADFIKEMKNK